MKDRLKQIRKHLGLSQIEFARRINVSPGFVSNIENGRCNLSEDTIENICSSFNVERDWLLYGKGEMFTPGNEKASAERKSSGDRVKKVRIDEGLSQIAFAERIGYSTIQVRFVEYHRLTPSNDFLAKVASVFGISFNWLLTGEGEEKAVEKTVVDEALIEWLEKNPDVVNELRLRAGLK